MFSVRTTQGSLIIILADVCICYPVLWLFNKSFPGYNSLLPSSPGIEAGAFFLFTLLIILSLALSRLYSFLEYIYSVDLLKRIIPSFFLSFVFIAALGFSLPHMVPLKLSLFPSLGATYLCLFAFRYYLFYILPQNRERILLLGATDQTREIVKESNQKRFKGYEIIGIVTSLENGVGKDMDGVPILGLMQDIEEILKREQVDMIVVTLRDRRGKLPVKTLLQCKVENIRVQEGSTFYERIKRKIMIDEFLKPSWFIFEDGFFYTTLHGSIKRWQGVLVSVILLTVCAPLMLLIAILIKAESPGPVFFRQERVGRNGRTFNLLKFRSMYQDAEEKSGPVYAQEKDPRVTKIGMVIRKSRLDEIPQFINILKGDMDLVGPRPERPFFVKQLEMAVPYYHLRHKVRPGLTGWAQVNFPYGDSIEHGKEKLQYDLYYVKHLSWYLDSLIIFLTTKEVLFGGGR